MIKATRYDESGNARDCNSTEFKQRSDHCSLSVDTQRLHVSWILVRMTASNTARAFEVWLVWWPFC